ncbi:hypothetical protein BP6252_03557 [Coleophoma cylindrospora]|uniref:Uncharacterized protein n=1 Tax=Coleophoma cylindrospora TaxID=1849047 RepID=A0A3D8S7Y7_9HELO|nr:hypothetical protein BP6252_03557 [Coleophoma cylindrospora]
MAKSLLLLLSLPLSLAIPSLQEPILDPAEHGENYRSANENANLIFNSIHSSMRQWGSSLQHNGMSFFPASIPEGTLFYHGRGAPEPVKGTEWLAFEVEHAENFARGRGGGGPGGRRPPGGPGGERPNGRLDSKGPPGFGEAGYLHVYRTNRRLDKILYIDGMSAGKTDMGTLDTQDILLLENNSTYEGAPMGGEQERAKGLCEMGKQWGGIEGFLRMEAGFEIIYCDFEDGLDFVQAHKRPSGNDGPALNNLHEFEYSRAIAARYHGIGGGRVEINYSSMVSAFFYPMNLSNPHPDPKQILPRLDSADTDGLARIKSDLKSVWGREKAGSTRWQDVVDMIMARYSDRLKYLGASPAADIMLSEINNLLNIYIDYNELSIEKSIETCTNHYLIPTTVSTLQDKLIHSAITTVMSKVCNTLFSVRQDLLSENESQAAAAVQIASLNDWLNWTTFLDCGVCKYDEVCYIAVWPWGTVEDHFSPKCKNSTAIGQSEGDRYWRGGPGRGRGPPGDGKGPNGPPPMEL